MIKKTRDGRMHSKTSSSGLPQGGTTVKTTLVLGIGNILWADEGFGVRAVEAFHETYADHPDVSVRDEEPSELISSTTLKKPGGSSFSTAATSMKSRGRFTSCAATK